MIDAKKTELFETKPIPKAVAQLAIPTVISSLVMVLYNLADTYFVGLIDSPVQTAAVTFAAPVILAFNALNNLFGTGCSSLMSRALGVKDYDTVKRTSTFGFYSALFCALLLSVFSIVFRPQLLKILGVDPSAVQATNDYMFWTVTCGAAPAILNVVLSFMIRAEGASLHASIGTMTGCLLNVILDPVFIMPWGFDMEASGAGCATFISNCVACIYFFILLFVKRKSTSVSLDPRLFCFRKNIIKGSFSVGIPAAIQNLLNVTGMTVLNNFTAEFGASAVAAMGITHKVNMIPMYISMGMGQGIMPLVGYNYSAKNPQRMKKAVVFTAEISSGFILAATAVYFIFAENIIGLFMNNAEIVAFGTRFLRGFCLGLPFLAIDFLAVGIFQAVGKGMESFIFAVMRKLVLEIPALIILNKIYPLYGLSYSQLCAEAVLAVAAVIVLSRLFSSAEKEESRRIVRVPIIKRSIGACIILSLITFGIYSIYWEYLLVKNTRAIKKDDSSCTGEMLCLIFVPFYSLFWWFTRGKLVRDEFSKHGHSASSNETAFLVLALFGLGIVAMAIMQNDFNSLLSESSQSNQRSVENESSEVHTAN